MLTYQQAVKTSHHHAGNTGLYRHAPSQPCLRRLLLLAFVLSLSSVAAMAKTFVVSNPAGLVAAIEAAESDTALDTINLQPGYYAVSAYYGGSQNAFPKITTKISIVASLGSFGQSQATLDLSYKLNCRFFQIEPSGQLLLHGVTLTHAYGGRNGGAILNHGRLIVAHSFFVRNQAADPTGQTTGGAIYNKFGKLRIYNSTFRENAANVGGAVCSDGSSAITPDPGEISQVEIFNSAFSYNRAFYTSWGEGRGGGIFIRGANNVALTDTTVSNNRVQGYGGGIAFHTIPQAQYVHLRNLTVVNNNALPFTAGSTSYQGEGGGLHYAVCGASICPLPTALAIGNTIVANNFANLNVVKDFGGNGTYQSFGHNIMGLGMGFVPDVDGSDYLNQAPLANLGPLTFISKPGQDHHLPLAGCLALDNGDPLVCSPTDQLGTWRGTMCEIGAIERLPSKPPGPFLDGTNPH